MAEEAVQQAADPDQPLKPVETDLQAGRKRSAGDDQASNARPKKLARLSSGDAERTESDSEVDSLFQDDSIPEDLSKQALASADQQRQALSQQQLLQRRLEHTRRLQQLYVREYWALLEEFRSRHNHILTKSHKTGESLLPQASTGGEPDSKPQFRSMRSLLQQAGTVLPQPDLIAPLTDPTVLQQQPSAENAHDAVPKDEEQTAVDQLPSDNANGVDMQHDTEVQQDDGLADGAGLMPQPMQVEVNGGDHFEPADRAESAPANLNGTPAPSQADHGVDAPKSSNQCGLPMLKAQPDMPLPEAPPELDSCDLARGVPDFEQVKAAVFGLDPSWPTARPQQLSSWRAAFRASLPEISRLEQAAAAAGAREMDRNGALATLVSHAVRYTIRCTAASLGRNTGSCGQVDIDLALAGCAKRVSRQQAFLLLRPDGKFSLRNIGRRSFFVNSKQVNQNQVAILTHLSHIDIGGLQLLFLVNASAVQRALARTQQHSVLWHA